MRIATLLTAGALLVGLPPRDAAAQQFVPPKGAAREGGDGTRIGLFGFGVRGGIDVEGDGQLVVGTALDIGDLFTRRIRLRPSAEIGVFNGLNTYIGSVEALWRFAPDDDVAIPYLGTGFSLAGHEDCGSNPECPGLWVNLVFGIELHHRSTYNWLLEWHGMDALRRHRFYIGLTTRRGN